jgi:hypothetical protein
VSEIEAEEIVKLSPKPRGILGTLFAAFVRSKFAALFAKREKPRRGRNTEDAREKTREKRPGQSGPATLKPVAPRAKDIPAGILAASDS